MHNYHTPLGFLNTYKYLISVCVCICVYQCWYHVALYLLSCDISVWKIIPTDKSVPGIHRSGTYKNLVQLSEFWNSHITRWTSTTYCKPLCKRGLSTFSKMPICRHFENYDSQAFVICHPIGETWLSCRIVLFRLGGRAESHSNPNFPRSSLIFALSATLPRSVRQVSQ